MHCFLKVLTTFYKDISEIINTIVMKERKKRSMRIRKYNIFTLKYETSKSAKSTTKVIYY